MRGWAGVAAPVLALLLTGTVARRRDLPPRVRRRLPRPALAASLPGLLRAVAWP